MGRPADRKVKWTFSFDSNLKRLVITAAKRKNISAVTLLEDLVREKFNHYGHGDVENSAAYVSALRKLGRKQSDEAFLAEIEAWQRSQSS